MPKKIFTQELEGTRRRGRPRKRRKEAVERDLQVLGVRRWRELVVDMKKWKDIVRQAKAHSGLYCQWKKKKKYKKKKNCYVCSVLGILFHCVVLCICLCVNQYCTTATGCQLLPPGVNPTAANKYLGSQIDDSAMTSILSGSNYTL